LLGVRVDVGFQIEHIDADIFNKSTIVYGGHQLLFFFFFLGGFFSLMWTYRTSYTNIKRSTCQKRYKSADIFIPLCMHTFCAIHTYKRSAVLFVNAQSKTSFVLFVRISHNGTKPYLIYIYILKTVSKKKTVLIMEKATNSDNVYVKNILLGVCRRRTKYKRQSTFPEQR